MKKLLLALCSVGILSTWGYAQQAPKIVCGQDLLNQKLSANAPEFKRAIERTFDQLKATPADASRDQMVYEIPVVVHIVWKDPEENLPDSVIQNQIDVLNADYGHTNADAGNLRAVFNDRVGDSGIRFRLHQVLRKQTTIDFEPDILGGGSDVVPAVKHDADGGSDALDPSMYLNIWVCEIQPICLFPGFCLGNILGYAFPPADLSNWPAGSSAANPDEDGVVIDFRVFGANNPNPMPDPTTTGANLPIRGRTPVHEVGHYLGLRHIWGDGGNPLTGAGSCDGEPVTNVSQDGIEDTPKQFTQSQFNCDTTLNSCVDSFNGNDDPDMVENYMDYSAETCMVAFTQGQINIMRASLVAGGPRCGLVNSCTPSGLHSALANTVVKIVPNPANQYIHVTAAMDNSYTVTMKNLLGQVVAPTQNAEYANQVLRFDVSALANGVYVVEVRAGNVVAAQKVVIHK